MTEVESKLIEIGKRYAAIGIQVANAYAAEQSELQLDLLLSRERLSSREGTAESLSTINRLEELTKTHKEVFKKMLMASSAENAAVLAELSQAEQHERLLKLAEMLNWHLVSQSAFYEAREQWIDAAAKICNLVQSCRDTAIFSETVQFAEDEALDEFEAQMARIENAHQIEVSLMNEKIDRLSKALAVVGIQPAG